MYKLLIADDEPLEREALRFFVENAKLEIDEIIECTNGLEAVNAALAVRPEICILDIKMPGLSGHEVLEQINAANKDCKVILSTAYSYFNYALKAVQLGAFDFLVKPVKKEVVLRTINKAIDQLDEERLISQRNARLNDAAHLLEKKMLVALLQGDADEEVLWFLDSKSLDVESGGCSFFVRITPDVGDRKKELDRKLRADLTEVGFPYILAVYANALHLLVFSRCPETLDSLTETVDRLVKNALFAMQADYRLGVGSWFNSLEQIEISYAQARASMGDLTFSSAEPAALSPEKQKAKPVGTRLPAQAPPEIEAVCGYIRQNYSEKISLDILSSEVGFSKYYISRLFKQYTGSTIIDYLIKVRMDKAKELLESNEHSIKQIGYMIGYSDPNYFTWAFKKNLGVSPMKYRYFQAMGG